MMKLSPLLTSGAALTLVACATPDLDDSFAGEPGALRTLSIPRVAGASDYSFEIAFMLEPGGPGSLNPPEQAYLRPPQLPLARLDGDPWDSYYDYGEALRHVAETDDEVKLTFYPLEGYIYAWRAHAEGMDSTTWQYFSTHEECRFLAPGSVHSLVDAGECPYPDLMTPIFSATEIDEDVEFTLGYSGATFAGEISGELDVYYLDPDDSAELDGLSADMSWGLTPHLSLPFSASGTLEPTVETIRMSSIVGGLSAQAESVRSLAELLQGTSLAQITDELEQKVEEQFYVQTGQLLREGHYRVALTSLTVDSASINGQDVAQNFDVLPSLRSVTSLADDEVPALHFTWPIRAECAVDPISGVVGCSEQ